MEQATKQLSKVKPRKGSCRIVMPTGKPDAEALRSFMLDCVVPLLADEFLKRRSAVSPAAIQVIEDDPTSQLLGEEGGL
jgi:hypothetical protein